VRHRPLTCLVAALVLVAVGCVGTGGAGAGAPGAEDPSGAPSTTATALPPVAGPSDEPSVPPEPPSEPTPTPTPAPTPLPPLDLGDLPQDLTAALREVPQGATVGVAVLAADGREVLDVEGDLPMLPASTAKVLTAAAALDVLGPATRLATWLRVVGERDADGVLRGHLLLEGDGDPTLTTLDYHTHVYASRPSTPVEDLAAQIAAAGVTRVTGGVVAAPDPLGDDRLAPGWKDAYLTALDARRISGLSVDAGLTVTLTSPPPELALELVADPDPTARLVGAVEAALRAAGVVVGAEPVVGDGAGDGSGDVLAIVRSPVVADQVRFALERSDNHLADTLVRVVGRELGDPGFVASGRAVRGVLLGRGVAVAGLRLVDGSGLSRDDRVTARTLAAVDRVTRAGELGSTWRDVGAEAGADGTLRRRLRGTVADGRFVGKTGTLSDVVGIVGTVEGPDGAPAFHVAVLHNGLRGASQRALARAVEDDVIRLLAEHAAGCERVPAPAPTTSPEPGGQPTPPPPVVVCPEVP
jgi:D-alanyl-D-alanine carboxypeptidase/D-alanyl-D-alanine-endopeptidase (penicillin-binding protein 4)